MSSVVRRWVRRTFGLIVGIGFLWLTLHRLDIAQVGLTMTKLRWPALVLALLFLTAGYGARVVRWWWMLRVCDTTLGLHACVWPLLISVAVNNVVPLRAGDVWRVVGFREQLGAPAVRVLGTLLIERMLDLTLLLGFLFIGIAGLANEGIPDEIQNASMVVAAVGTLAWIVLLLSGRILERWLLQLCRHQVLVTRGWGPRAEVQIRHFFIALDVIRIPTLALRLLALSAVVWACEGAVFVAVAAGLGYSGGILGPWFALATGTLATLLPSSPGYVGTFDFFTMSGFMAYGGSRDFSAAAALLVHLVLWLPLTAAGITYLLLPKSKNQRHQVTTSVTLPRERM